MLWLRDQTRQDGRQEPVSVSLVWKALRIPSYYYPIPWVVAVLVCAALGYAFGLKSYRLVIFVIVFWFPITAFLFAVLKLKINPKIHEHHPDNLDLNPRD